MSVAHGKRGLPPPPTKFPANSSIQRFASLRFYSGVLQPMDIEDKLEVGTLSQRTRKAIVDDQGNFLIRRVPFEVELTRKFMPIKVKGNHRRHIIPQNNLKAYFTSYFSTGNGKDLDSQVIAQYCVEAGLPFRNNANGRAQLLSEMFRAINSHPGNLFEEDGGENTAIGLIAPQIKTALAELRKEIKEKTINSAAEARKYVIDKLEIAVLYEFAKKHADEVKEIITNVIEDIDIDTVDDMESVLEDFAFSLDTDLPKRNNDPRTGVALQIQGLFQNMDGKASSAQKKDNFWVALELFFGMSQ
jgi:hypothetical protein